MGQEGILRLPSVTSPYIMRKIESTKKINLDKPKKEGSMYNYKNEIVIRLLDIIKWAVILMIAGIIFYLVCPKYYFNKIGGTILERGNEITGRVKRIR
jgi:hypothetical protein